MATPTSPSFPSMLPRDYNINPAFNAAPRLWGCHRLDVSQENKMTGMKWLQRISESIDPFVQRYGSPDSVKKFFVYSYHYIDFHDYTQPAQEVLEHWSLGEDFIAALKELWLAHGWDGDGAVTSIWLPPFLVEDLNDEVGQIIWHVKQLEDGTSWLASDKAVSQIERHRVLPEQLDIEDQTVPPDNDISRAKKG